MAGPWYVANERIDARGHVAAIRLARYTSLDPPEDEWFWYDLAGDASGHDTGRIFPHATLALRLDTRGHVIAVLQWFNSGEEIAHWYDLAGNDLGEGSFEWSLSHLRIDTRGHVLAIQLKNGDWYDLNGELVA